MVFNTIAPRRRPVLTVAALGFAVATLSGATAVRAADDEGMLNSVLSFVGLQPDKEKDIIDYRARPPLVVPPKKDLPPPVPAGAGRTAEWPNDPDVQARRRAAADSRRPAPQLGPNARAESTKDELMAGRSGVPDRDTRTTDCTSSSGTPSCLYVPWDKLKNTVLGDEDKTVAVGAEPPRDYLTEPPVGYRKPTSVVKVTVDPVKTLPDAGDAGAYSREQGRHKTSVDE